VIVAGPVPIRLDVMLSHPAFDAALQRHRAPVFNLNEPLPPFLPIVALVGVIWYEHNGPGSGPGVGDGSGDGLGVGVGDGLGFGVGVGLGVGAGGGAGAGSGVGNGASCVMENGLSAMVTVAERGPFVVFRSTVIDTVPLPELPVVSKWIHGSPTPAVHAHPDVAVTLTVRLPPFAPTCAVDAFNSKRHGAGSCEMVTRWSLTTTAAERAAAWGFDWIVATRAESPWPEAGETLIHDASLDAVQLHSRAAPTVTLTVPPVAGTLDGGIVRDV
jgi:hypothetical protein